MCGSSLSFGKIKITRGVLIKVSQKKFKSNVYIQLMIINNSIYN